MPAPGPYRALVLLELALAALTFVGLRFVTAPYGRHGRGGWGPTVSARLGWLIMESPAPLLFAGGAEPALLVGVLPLSLGLMVLLIVRWAFRSVA